MSTPSSPCQPFDLSDEAGYHQWRELKLADYPAAATELVVDVKDPARLDAVEYAAIMARCRKANVAIYTVSGGSAVDKAAIRRLGRQFGLERLDMNLRADEDSITSVRVVPELAGTHYIPYTSRPLNWHTDGYYNTLDRQVRGIVMHCVAESAAGGSSLLLDPEIAYIRIRDEKPAYIEALMQPDAMTIPPNVENGIEIRPAQTGPVFSLEKPGGALHMRYTARTRSIAWKDDRNTRLAVGFLAELLGSEPAGMFRHRLRTGQGIICNNVLHKREAFVDDAASDKVRILYRARYHDRIHDPGAGESNDGVSQCSG